MFRSRRLLLGVGAGVLAGLGGLVYRAHSLSRDFAWPPGSNIPSEQELLVLSRTVQSGDVLLFDRSCVRFSPFGVLVCSFAKVTQNSPWDHVGIVVRVPGVEEAQVVEADFLGVRVRPFLQRIQASQSKIVLRHLEVRRDEVMLSKLNHFVHSIKDTPYERDYFQLIRNMYDTEEERKRMRILADIATRQHIIASQYGHLQTPTGSLLVPHQVNDGELAHLHKQLHAAEAAISQHPFYSFLGRNNEDLSSVFCSELVAAAYQRMDLLPVAPPSNDYTPVHFAGQPLPLRHGARLSSFIRLK